MVTIEKISKIKREALSSENYFESLLEQAYRSGLLSDKDLERIQVGCLSLLAQKVEQYNNGDSSSIRVEAAQSLLASILFTMGLCLKAYPCPDDAVAELQNKSLAELYQKGREDVDRLIKSTKILHASFIGQLMETENVFYSSTVVDGIKGFFKLYSPEFTAHEIHITADYPVHQRMEPLEGIEFIQKYLECIYHENLFCTQFSKEDLHHLLCGYSEDYEQLLFNIYEPVLTVALGCILAGRHVYRLALTPEDVQGLNALFDGKKRAEIAKMLGEALDSLSGSMALRDSLKDYLVDSLPQIAASIENALQFKTLDRVFIVPRYPENKETVIVSFGVKMDNETYRKVLEELMQCRYLADKKALIKNQIKSLADLEDILLDAMLYEEEILSILGELTPGEFAALVKKHLVTSELEPEGIGESEGLLCDCLKKLLSALPQKQQDFIGQVVERVEIQL